MNNYIKKWNIFLKEESDKEDIDKVVKAVLYSGDTNQFLALKNDVDVTYDLPGGHIRRGEGELAALSREIKEETNLDIDDSKVKKIAHKGNTCFYMAPWPKDQSVELSEEHHSYESLELFESIKDKFSDKQSVAITAALEHLREDT